MNCNTTHYRANSSSVPGDPTELKLLSRAQRWEEMPARINDEVLHTYVTVGTYDQIAEKLTARYGKVVTHCEFSIPVKDKADEERLRALAKTIQAV